MSRPGYSSIDTTVKGGFPVTFWFKVCGPDRSVGLTEQYIDDCYFTTRSGKPCKWLKISEKDEARVCREAFDSFNNDQH